MIRRAPSGLLLFPMSPSAPDLAAAMAGSPEAIDQLVTDWGPTILRWCARLGGPRIDVDDAAQDSLERVLRKLPTLRDPAAFPAFVFQTCRGVIAQHRRHAWLRRWIGPIEHEPPVPPADPVAREVHEAVDQLPRDAREVLVLCDLEERTEVEVAALLGIPVGTVKSRRRRARVLFATTARERGLDLACEVLS